MTQRGLARLIFAARSHGGVPVISAVTGFRSYARRLTSAAAEDTRRGREEGALVIEFNFRFAARTKSARGRNIETEFPRILRADSPAGVSRAESTA